MLSSSPKPPKFQTIHAQIDLNDVKVIDKGDYCARKALEP